jgi:signal transduction histidine kinase
MTVGPGRRGAIAFFVTLGASLVVLATALNIGWIVLNRQNIAPMLFGVFILAAIIAGLILNTTFLVREIRRNAQHDAFVNAVTHELKTPITSIRLHLDTLDAHDATLSPAKRREFYGIMRNDSDRLLHTIEQVLRAGQADHVPLHRARVDLPALAEECVDFTRTRFRLPDDAIRFVAPSGREIAVIGDAGLLRGAALNLIDNAVKYSSQPVRVEVTVTRQGDRALLRVRDYGTGLAADELKRIFRRFYRIPGPTTQRVKGAGLGLFIVRSAARRHGGRAFAESAGPGTGATFSLELPVAPPAGAGA